MRIKKSPAELQRDLQYWQVLGGDFPADHRRVGLVAYLRHQLRRKS